MISIIEAQENYNLAISALRDASNDHFDGEHAIYRLTACVPIKKGTSPDGVQRQLNKLKKELLNLEVRADRIIIFDDMLEINFFPRGYQMAMTRGQYSGLQLEFAEFLNDSNISGIKIQDGCYNDTPEESVKSASNSQINFFPEFNSSCFGGKEGEPMEVCNCHSDKEYMEVA